MKLVIYRFTLRKGHSTDCPGHIIILLLMLSNMLNTQSQEQYSISYYSKALNAPSAN